jgi:hypothetical protein
MKKRELEGELSKIDEISQTESNQEIQTTSANAPLALSIDRVVWGVWWIGTILVVLSWLSVVSNTIGWIGFAAAIASTVVSVLARKYWRVPR